MPNCEDKSCDRCDEYEIRDFWITFPYPEENSSFVPDISYMHDGRKIETEIVMSIADWSRLFKAEGIDPEGALCNSSEPLHFVKSTLVHRGWRSVVPIFCETMVTVEYLSFKN